MKTYRLIFKRLQVTPVWVGLTTALNLPTSHCLAADYYSNHDLSNLIRRQVLRCWFSACQLTSLQ